MSLKRVAASDGETHLIYPTARRTLCGTSRALVRGVPGRAGLASCAECAATAARLTVALRAWRLAGGRNTGRQAAALQSALRALGTGGDGLSGSLRYP